MIRLPIPFLTAATLLGGVVGRAASRPAPDSSEGDMEIRHGLMAWSYTGNPTCSAKGFDFGWKLSGCSSEGGIEFDSLHQTAFANGVQEDTCKTHDLGMFNLVCSDPIDERFQTATISPNVHSVVMVKGGRGGILYSGLDAGQTYSIDGGDDTGVHHIEFCFNCNGSIPLWETASFVTPSPTTSPNQPEGDCQVAPDIFHEDYTAPDGKTYSVKKYSGNPNCLELGFAYGWKMDENCYPGSGLPFGAWDDYRHYGKTTGTCDAGFNPSGTFDIACETEDDGQYIDARITPSRDVHVIMKGGNGGTVYQLQAGVEAVLDVGQRKGISHIEFCFVCNKCGGDDVTTDSPTTSPTTFPTTPPTSMPSSTDSPTTAPTNTPTSAPSTSTDSPTNSPTSMPTVEPTDSPTDRPTSSPTEPTEVFVPEINLEVCDFTVELYGRSTGFLADDVKVGFSSPGLEDSYVTGHLNVTLDRYRFEFLEPCSTDVVSVIIENAGNVEVEIQNMKVSRNGTVLFNNGCFDLGIEDSCASFEFTLGEQCGESLDSFGGIKLDACQVLVSNLTENTKTCQYTLDCTPFIGVIEEGKPLTYENNLPSVYYEGFLDCAERGYDFGYQMENCVPGNAIPFDNLFRTPFHAGVDRGTCQITNLGDFNLVCSDRDMEDGGLPRTATVTTSVDAVVMIQGENGGTLYTDLQAGDTYILGVGDNDAISDIEFCFRCPSVSVTAEDTSTYAPTTSPTFTPTIAITGSPTASGTEAETNVATQVATEATSTAAPTEGQTSSPTESPTSAPTDKPGPPGERYSGTLDCADRGEFDFGFQLEYCVPGKELKIDALDQTPFKKDVDQATCLVSNLGNFDLQCSDRDMNNGGLPRKATFTPHVDTAVLVQGNSGGTIYRDLKSGQTYDLEVGTGEPITTIELCLKCGNTKTTDRSASSFGDPHIKTWGGGHFDFHGGCDLVLLDSPAFANGLGLSVHIRTRIRTWWSYIDSVVLKIGSDRLEVQGGRDNSVRYWTNGKLGPDLKPDGQFLNFTMSGHKIWYHSVSTKTKQFRLTWDAFNSFSLETFGDFVRFNVNAKRPDDFRGARGLMGSYPSGAHMGRNGQLIWNTDAFGQEWQVRFDEPNLFHSNDGVQHPERCEIPSHMAPKWLRRRQLGESLSRDDAASACAHAGKEYLEDCIFDVLATNDKGMAASY